MRLYYGTTSAEARRIQRQGLRPRPDSPTLWCSRSLAVAQARARQQCRCRPGRPAVVVCELDLAALRQALGPKSVHRCGPMVGLRGRLDASAVSRVLPVSSPGDPDSLPESVLTAHEAFGLLESNSPRLRRMGVMILAAQESAEAFDWLCTRLNDSDPQVRLAVVLSLRRRGPVAGELLCDLQGDADPLIRQAAGSTPAAFVPVV